MRRTAARPPALAALAALALLAAAPGPSARAAGPAAPAAPAAPTAVAFTLEDPAGDDHGPGGYLYPTGAEYRPGDFDLRRFTVRVEGQEAVLEVTLGANVRRTVVAQRGDRGDLVLENGIWVQNVDVYVDTTPGAGFTQGLPGRRVAFPAESAWDKAVTIVPMPGPMRTELSYWSAEAAPSVLTPGPVRSTGQTLTVRVPLAFLGGPPQPGWGWSVQVSGALWDPSFRAVDRLRGNGESRALTLPVYGVPEERAFGGGKLNSGNPHVVDVLLPPGVTQAEVLGLYGPQQPAVVPMVYPDAGRARQVAEARTAREAASPPPAPAPPAAPAGPSAPVAGGPLDPGARPAPPVPAPPAAAEGLTLEVASVDGETAVVPTPQGGLRAWQLGTVLDGEGRPAGRVVVTKVGAGFALVSLTDGAVKPGQKVRFAR
jgi:hypothetical protein